MIINKKFINQFLIKSLSRPSFEVPSSAVNTANCHSTDAAPNVLKDVIVSGGAMLGRHNREDELLHYIDSYGPLVVCIQVDKKGRFAIITMNTILIISRNVIMYPS